MSYFAKAKDALNAVGRVVAPEEYAPIAPTEEQLIDKIIIAEDDEFEKHKSQLCLPPSITGLGPYTSCEVIDFSVLTDDYKHKVIDAMNKLRTSHNLTIPQIFKKCRERDKVKVWLVPSARNAFRLVQGWARYRKITEKYFNSDQRRQDAPELNPEGNSYVLRNFYDGSLGSSKRKGKKATKKKDKKATEKKGKKATKNKGKKATKKKDKKATKKKGKKATKKAKRGKKSI